MSEAYFMVSVGTAFTWYSLPLPFFFTRTVEAPSFSPASIACACVSAVAVVMPVSVVLWACWASKAFAMKELNRPFLAAVTGGGGGAVTGGGALRGRNPSPGTEVREPKPVIKYCCTAPNRADTA